MAVGMNLIILNHNYLGKTWVYKPVWIPEEIVLDCADESQQAQNSCLQYVSPTLLFHVNIPAVGLGYPGPALDCWAFCLR